jgi:hypothetical protein
MIVNDKQTEIVILWRYSGAQRQPKIARIYISWQPIAQRNIINRDRVSSTNSIIQHGGSEYWQ